MASCWVSGLPQNADRDNVRVFAGLGQRLSIDWIGEPDAKGIRQLNAIVPKDMAKGESGIRIECAGVASDSWRVKFVRRIAVTQRAYRGWNQIRVRRIQVPFWGCLEPAA
jgi:hypothetical protein